LETTSFSEAKLYLSIEALHYAMSLPTSVVITGIDKPEILDQALEASDIRPEGRVERSSVRRGGWGGVFLTPASRRDDRERPAPVTPGSNVVAIISTVHFYRPRRDALIGGHHRYM
jgi:hypothetical protein